MELQPTPTLNDTANSALFSYLRNVSGNSEFSKAVLQVLIDERRDYHRRRANSNKTPSALKVGDVVKAHVTVHSDKDKDVVGKLSYQVRGPFIVTQRVRS